MRNKICEPTEHEIDDEETDNVSTELIQGHGYCKKCDMYIIRCYKLFNIACYADNMEKQLQDYEIKW